MVIIVSGDKFINVVNDRVLGNAQLLTYETCTPECKIDTTTQAGPCFIITDGEVGVCFWILELDESQLAYTEIGIQSDTLYFNKIK